MYGCKECSCVTAAFESELDSWNFFVIQVKMWTHGLMTLQGIRDHVTILNLIFCAGRYLNSIFLLLVEPYSGLLVELENKVLDGSFVLWWFLL